MWILRATVYRGFLGAIGGTTGDPWGMANLHRVSSPTPPTATAEARHEASPAPVRSAEHDDLRDKLSIPGASAALSRDDWQFLAGFETKIGRGAQPERSDIDMLREITRKTIDRLKGNVEETSTPVKDLVAVAGNHNTPPEILASLAGHKDIDVLRAVVENCNTPPETLRALAGNPDSPPEILDCLAGHNDIDVLRAVAGNRNTPTDVLVILADNSYTPLDTLESLAGHNDVGVLQAVARNCKTPPGTVKAVLETLVKGTDAPAAKAAFITLLQATDHPQAAELLRNVDTIAAEGRLTRPVMEQLLALADQTRTPLHPGIDKAPPESPNRQEILFHALKDLAQPSAINQGQWGTCAATGVQMALALRDPARYVALLRDLCHPAPDHATGLVPGLKRPDDQDLSQPDQKVGTTGGVTGVGNRTITARLMSPAMMNLASEGSYRTVPDQHVYADQHKPPTIGLDDVQRNRLIKGVLGIDATNHAISSGPGPYSYAAMVDEAKHGPIQVVLKWGTSAHAVAFVGTASDEHGNQFALLLNPWGARHTMPLDDFKNRLESAHFPDDPKANNRIPFPSNALDLSKYEKLAQNQYKTSPEVLTSSPEYKSLGEDDKFDLLMFVSANLSPTHTAHLVPHIIVGGKFVDDTLLARLNEVASRHDGQPQKEARVCQQMLNAIFLNGDTHFKGLDESIRKSILQLLADKDVPNSDALKDTIGSLAAKGRMTADFLDQLATKANAVEVVAAMNSENDRA